MVKNLPAMQETRVQSLDWQIPWWREWLPTPVFLPGEFHRQRSLEGYSPWGSKESDTTATNTLTFKHSILLVCLDTYCPLFHMGRRFIYSNWLWIYQVYVCYPSLSLSSITFHLQMCPGVVAKPYEHYGRAHHTAFSCPTLPPLEVWVPHRLSSAEATLSNLQSIQELWTHS